MDLSRDLQFADAAVELECRDPPPDRSLRRARQGVYLAAACGSGLKTAEAGAAQAQNRAVNTKKFVSELKGRHRSD